MPTEEPSDENVPRPEKEPEPQEPPSADDDADREPPPRVARRRDREWGFLTLALPRFLVPGTDERRSR